jgi:hypothetical protein
MTLLQRVGSLLWNKQEKRLRALCRMAAHTIALFAFTTTFTLGLTFVALVADAIFGLGIRADLAETGGVAFTQTSWIFMMIIPAAAFLGVLLATLITGKFIDKRKFRAFGVKFSKVWWVDFAFGLGLGAVLMGLIFAFGWLTGNIRVTGFFQPFNEDLSFLSGFAQALIFYFFVGIYEELLSRGYHLVNLSEGLNLKPIGKTWGIFLAVLLSSSVFGLLHIRNPHATWVSTLNITIAGIVFSLGMIFTGRLAIPMGLHITWNFFQGSVFGFPVSGTRNGATLIATEALGPDWLTGGSFGPEAGVMGLSAMLLGGLLILIWIRRKGQLSLKTELAEFYPKEASDPA